MKLKRIGLFFITIVFFLSCIEKKENSHNIKALPISAEINNENLTGPNILGDSNNFVWGASVIKGDDKKYHMLYSFWESGEDKPKFADGWLLLSKMKF